VGHVEPVREIDVRRLARIVAPLAIVIAAAACGGDSQSTTAASSLNLDGSWTGMWQFQSSGLTITDAVTATASPYLSQETIAWQAASGPSGSFFLANPGAAFSGTLNVQQSGLGLNCAGTGAMTGTATASTLTLDVPSISGSSCQWSTSNHFVLHR
jgi:hypothetical protein